MTNFTQWDNETADKVIEEIVGRDCKTVTETLKLLTETHDLPPNHPNVQYMHGLFLACSLNKLSDRFHTCLNSTKTSSNFSTVVQNFLSGNAISKENAEFSGVVFECIEKERSVVSDYTAKIASIDADRFRWNARYLQIARNSTNAIHTVDSDQVVSQKADNSMSTTCKSDFETARNTDSNDRLLKVANRAKYATCMIADLCSNEIKHCMRSRTEQETDGEAFARCASIQRKGISSCMKRVQQASSSK